MVDVRVFCRVVLTGVLSAALCAFLAAFDGLLMSKFLAGVHARTLPVRIWNSLNLQVEPTIAAVSGRLIGVTTLILSIEAVLRPPRGTTPRARLRAKSRVLHNQGMARCVADPRAAGFADDRGLKCPAFRPSVSALASDKIWGRRER